jgi:hypothetical protein
VNDTGKLSEAVAVKSSLWRSLMAVFWSFLGLRQTAERQEDMAKITPFHLIAVGLAVCFAFVIGLMFFVKWVVAR